MLFDYVPGVPMHRQARTRSIFVRAALAGLLGLPVLLAGAVLQPAAAVAGPTGLTPDGTTVSGTPVLSWDALTGSTSYTAEVYDGATKLASVSTVNSKWVPTIQLPTGHTLTWRVHGRVGGVDTDWSNANFTRSAVTAPSLVSPVGGVTLDQPGDPLVYRWTAVPGANTYTVEVGPDPDFVDPALVKTYTTSATSIAPNIIPSDGDYHWRVTANLSAGVKSNRSAVGDYSVAAVIRSGGNQSLPQLPQYPANDQTIQEVVLDWHPIDGAATYKLQVSTDSNFLTIVHSATGIMSTRYSPPTTLDNDQYWWRIAPVNADGFQTPWESSPTWRFTRRWPDQATLQYPADNATVADPFYFQWSPVPLASRYELDMSPNQSFTPADSVTTCSTVHTTYTPGQSAGDCWPGAAGTFYWRVRAYDESGGVVSEVVNGQVHQFTYDPDLITLLAPANGATVTVPTLSWQPFPNADSYEVSLTNTTSSSTSTRTTVGTTMTWPTKLTAGTTYKWQVRPVFDDGRKGASILLASQPSFTAQDPAAGVAATPEPISAGPAAVRPPLLTWTAVAGATSYKVQVRAAGTIGWTQLPDTFAYASGNDTTGVKLSPGTYEWQVVSSPGNVLSSTTGTYTILPFAAVSGYRAAITGNDSGSVGTSCAATLPSNCQNLRQTPVLRWDAVEGAASYSLVISNDINLTNPVQTVIVRGTNIWMDPAALPDANAGTAYYWDVVPCGPTGICRNQVPATHQFNKTGLPVTLTSPLLDPDSPLPNDVTFTWQDYLATLQADSGAGSSLTTDARTEARQYRIQVSSTADFSVLLDNKVVDQTTYTPYDRTYPEQPLYWRVQAIDGTGNALPWSGTGTVTKSSPGPTLTDGINHQVFNGSISLGWAPLAYAKTYTVQVFPDGANPDITTPLLSQSGLKQNAYTPSAPMPPGDYMWRVRRADADGRAGQWSSLGTFTSTGSAPTLVSPADSAEVPPSAGLFTWQPASASAPVASYRIQLTRAEGSSPSPVTTLATAYAPTGLLADGHWTWAVTAFDSDGNAIGTSTRQFVVAGTLSPGTVTITGTGQLGDLLTINPLSWNVTPTTITYQWYRASSPISGATSSTYAVTATDVGKTLKVLVTGFKAGYSSGSGTFSNTINAVAGPTQILVNAPTFSGSRTVGSTLTGSPGTWTTTDSNGGPDSFSYQWLRNGSPISGATASTYKVAAIDSGRALSVRVTAIKATYPNASATSTGGTVAKAGSKTTEALAKSRIRRTKHGIVYARVTAPSPIPITGTLRVYDGSRILVTVTLSASSGGKRTITLPRLKRGRHHIWVKYLGNAQLTSSYSSQLTLRVTR